MGFVVQFLHSVQSSEGVRILTSSHLHSTLSFLHPPALRHAAMESASQKYPGVNLPLRHLAQCGKPGTDFYRLGSFDGAADSMSELLQVREVAMMILMDRLTDSPDWHEKVFDDAIVANWRSEALTQQAEEARYEEVVSDKTIPMPKRTRIITDAAFDYVGWVILIRVGWNRQMGRIGDGTLPS